ncbi:DUF1080 domain-containing protein [Lutimonas halocynthiae]|uniref:3-keto-disaccharide hydrolase n=1 Tax=Lutimonas halocynthiae TaxID=1446477 RepID=UPI0025B40F11|nr:DUF1080 domain-containing protein [Lutimonas halocynthiae]MDN3643533.1 DUF1080 domain-containing protein [Lutimonas halocynthiae]
MKIIPLSIIIIFLSISLINCKKEQVSSDQKKWVSLFNGVDLDNWNVKIKGHPLGVNYKNTFTVRDSVIKVDYSEYETFDNSFGHLFYETPFANYRLKLAYRFLGEQVKGGEDWATRNSGVMIHCQDPETMELDQNFPVCVEVQLLGGLEQDVPRSTANLCTPGSHVHMNNELVTTHCIDSNSKTFYGDEWVNLEIEVRNDSLISHYINGEKVLEYDHPIIGGEYNSLTELEGKELKQGYISLQSESHPVEFKNIMVLQLD